LDGSYYALFSSDSEIVDKLLSKGADLNLPDADGATPLIAAIIFVPPAYNSGPDGFQRAEGIVFTLLQKGADPNRRLRILLGLPNGITAVAAENVSKMRYRPAIRDGQPVEAWTKYETTLQFTGIRPR
jgi:hypothetical protein